MSYTKDQLRESTLDEKCVWFEKVWERVTRELVVMSGKLAGKVESLELTEIETQLDDLEDDLEVIETKFEIAQQLKDQYTESIHLMISNKLIQQDPENPERYFYRGDYNGEGKEPDSQGKDFTKTEFNVPTFQTILSRLTFDKLRLIRKMKEEGLEPRLQLTPIAYMLETLAQTVDSIGTELDTMDPMDNMDTTILDDDIKEEELKYSPTSVKASSDKQSIEISGEMTRSAWIEAHNGFLVDIVATEPELGPDLEIQIDADGVKNNFNAVQAEKYFKKMTSQGYSPMSYFSYLLAQMSAIQKGKPLERENFSLLLDSSLIKNTILARGLSVGGLVSLYWYDTKHQHAELRVRPSVRLC